uniref:Uncharacterized protein n=2 Tax=Enterobacteriaceae TaxID=543 RepID=A0A6D1P0E1_ECOLX|nr:hypothetical protein [Escherichia coli]QNT37670.1 hypothetical protein [Citrobacter braakii]QOC77291.1 hypothetical protein [Escherichia coli]UDP43493.1 hypothetical protein [Escherichia coli]UMW97912.1 hypothetical protein [Escherichia coli]
MPYAVSTRNQQLSVLSTGQQISYVLPNLKTIIHTHTYKSKLFHSYDL